MLDKKLFNLVVLTLLVVGSREIHSADWEGPVNFAEFNRLGKEPGTAIIFTNSLPTYRLYDKDRDGRWVKPHMRHEGGTYDIYGKPMSSPFITLPDYVRIVDENGSPKRQFKLRFVPSFKSSRTIQTVHLGKFITNIGKEVFAGSTIESISNQWARTGKYPEGFSTHVENDPIVRMQVKEALINDSLEFIGERAFIGSNLLSFNVGINSRLNYIGEDAFRACENLRNVSLKTQRVVSIESKAFAACDRLHYIYMPLHLSMTKVDHSIFADTSPQLLYFPRHTAGWVDGALLKWSFGPFSQKPSRVRVIYTPRAARIIKTERSEGFISTHIRDIDNAFELEGTSDFKNWTPGFDATHTRPKTGIEVWKISTSQPSRFYRITESPAKQ